MEDRININGTWYVRENSAETSSEPTEKFKKDLIHFHGCSYENDDYCWEASILHKKVEEENIILNGTLSIEFCDKQISTKEKEYWDNSGWFLGILNNDPESLKYAKESMCSEGIETFKMFLKVLKSYGWI